jgi:HK97 family phage major capsid protein/HK97 family phage prohead protease
MDRAYSLLHVKALDEDRRVFTGIATTPTPDRMGDVIEPLGVKYANPLPLLLFHDHTSPVGQVTFEKPTDKGINFTARIPKIDEAGKLKDRVDEAWQTIKAGLVKGVSVGFRVLNGAMEGMRTGGYRFKETEVLELSLVAVPANAEATILTLKQFDTHRRAASGQAMRVPSTPGASGSARVTTMNASEQLTAAKAALQTKSARLEELMTKDQTDGGLEADEQKELETVAGEVPTLTEQVKRYTALEAAQAAGAQSLTVVGGRDRLGRAQVVPKEYPKGTLFTRYALAVAAGKGSYSDTLAYAKRFTDTPEIAGYVKAMFEKAVEGTSVVASPGWGGELVNPATAMTEFVELLMPQTIIGRVQGFRRVPFNIPIITQTGGSTFEWVGEGAPKPVGELAFERSTLGYTKCAGIVVLTEELIRLSTPNAEDRARGDLIEQCAKFLDEQFIKVSIAAGASNPASITYGVSSPAATGTDVDAVKADLMTALGTFTAAKIPISGLAIVTTPDLALGLSMLTNALGQAPAGFNVTPAGGTLLGYPVIVSESVDAGTVVIFKPSEIFLADDGQVRLDASNQATLDMNGTSTPVFSLWQRNCVGLRAERWINWKKRRDSVVAVIDTASYGPTAGSPA